MKIGLINNPLSRSNRTRGLQRIAEIADRNGVLRVMETDMSGLDETLARFAREGVELIAVNGGDGTVRNVLTRLWRDQPFATPPPLAVLRGGRSNTIAADCGLSGPPERAFQRLLDTAKAGRIADHVVERRLIRVEGSSDGKTRYGMVLVAAGAVPIIEVSRSQIDPLGLPVWASDLISLGNIISWTVRRPREAFPPEGYAVEATVDGQAVPFTRSAFVLASTLHTHILNALPFWNTSSGPVMITMVRHPPRGMFWRLPRLLYGGEVRDLPADRFYSRGAHETQLAFDGRFAMDGEFFEAASHTPLCLTAQDGARFVAL